MILFQKASIDDALSIVQTRQKCWDATYRGIYPDEVIDNYDYEWHLNAEQKRLLNLNYHCWRVLAKGECVGYLSCGMIKDGGFWLHSLYLLPGFQKLGLGRKMFELVRQFCLDSGYNRMKLDCHPDNKNALAFYQHMGGIITSINAGHDNKQEDSCTIEYCF